jgi:hypothetical protein
VIQKKNKKNFKPWQRFKQRHRFNRIIRRKQFLRREKAGFLVGFVCCNGHAGKRAFCILMSFKFASSKFASSQRPLGKDLGNF